MNSTEVGYFGNTRSKVEGRITSYFYVLFMNQLNFFLLELYFFKKQLSFSICKPY